MSTVELCPDLQSPELDVPCTTTATIARGPSYEPLPTTGLELWVYVLLALIMVAIGLAIRHIDRRLEEKADDAE
jgi:hypothetical protein